MAYLISEEAQELLGAVKEFCEKEVKEQCKEYDRSGEWPKEIYDKAIEMQLHMLEVPEEYGGMGLSRVDVAALFEEMAKADAGFATTISASGLGTKPVLIAGSEELKKRACQLIVDGGFGAFCLTEPGAGSDASAGKTTAVKDGDSYILNGRKCFITMAPIADQCIVYAKTDPEKGAKGITCFMVDMNLPGVSCGRHEEKMGQRGVPVSDVVLEDVRVPKDCVIGEVGMGFINAMKTLSVGRVGVSSMCLGMAQEAIDLAVNHTKNRVQFGKPLAKMQALQFMMADMETKLNAARLLTYNAAYLLDTRQPADKAASMAKYYSAEAAIEIVNKSLQLHGGYGYSREYEIERIYRDVRVCSIYEGSSQVQQMVISGQLLK